MFTNKQPKDGDTVLLCEHARQEGVKGHFFFIPEPLMFVRPDGTGGKASWICLCDECFNKCPNPDLKSLMNVVRSDAVWDGDDPAIQVDPRVN